MEWLEGRLEEGIYRTYCPPSVWIWACAIMLEKFMFIPYIEKETYYDSRKS